MKQKIHYLFMLLLMLLTGVGGVKADGVYSLTPNQESTGSNATAYITTLTEFTYNDISWKMNQWNPKTLQVKTNQSSAASEFRFYNTSAFAGKIKKVVITFSALTVSDASKLMFLGGTSEVTATTGGTAGTWNSKEKTLTWTPASTDNFTYFAFYQNGKAASGSNYLAETNAIVVTYEDVSDTRLPVNITGFTASSAVLLKGETTTTSVTNDQSGWTPAYTYTSNRSSVATVDYNGEITAVGKGTATITVSLNVSADDENYKVGETTSKSIDITVNNPKHTATFSINGEVSMADVEEGEVINFPSVDDVILGKNFVGWTTTAIEGTTNEKPAELLNAATMGYANVDYYAVFANKQGEVKIATLTADERFGTGYKEKSFYDDLGNEWSGVCNSTEVNSPLPIAYGLNDTNSNKPYIQSPTFDGIISEIKVVAYNASSTENRTFTLKSDDNVVGSILVAKSTQGKELSANLNGEEFSQFTMTANKALQFGSIAVTFGSTTYSGYCTTLTLAAPTFSPAAGEVEKGTEVTISAEKGATLKYTVGEVAMTSESNTATVTINEDVTIKAVAVKDGVESEEVSAAYTVKAEEPVVEPGTPAAITAGFYTIKNLGNENEKFVNVAGRKTATLVDNAEGMAGTVIQVESDADGIVKTLRSQGVDVPGYATRAMKYVPDVVKLVVEKLHVSGSGEILGETGVDKILDKFNKSVDVNLHVVHADGGYRIYGKTPSMTPVKEFYKENKANVDAKLPGLEQAINDAIATIVDKVGKGESLKNTFKLETIWERMGKTLREPGTEEATQVEFLQQVLANEENIWNFAYQTAMFYMEWVEGKQAFQEMQEEAPELMKYWNLAKKVRPDFMYYIVQKDGKVDVISQGNEAILNNDKSTVWALEEVSEFKVNLATSVEKTAYPTTGGEAKPYTEYYGTLYTDFAYRLPEGVTAYKVTGINTVGDKAYVKKAVLNSEVVPAQTPVLLIANTGELTLTIAEGGEAVADNQLYGNDYLINEYDINTPQLEGVFNLLAELSQSTYDKYEYLMRKNAGTVNNKYFFGIAVEGELNKAYKDKTGKEMESSPVLKLGLTDGKVGFFESWNYLAGNEGFMFSEEVSEILMNIVGDVNRDGTITISDVTALVNIILGKATYPADADKYDFEAADVNGDKVITISDVTALVNIILGK